MRTIRMQAALWTITTIVAGSLAVLAAPSATADPRGVFLCVENASDGPVRLLMGRNDTNAPGPNILQPGWSRCAESTPQVEIGIRPGEDYIVSETNFSWLVSASRTRVRVGYGIQSRRAGWVRFGPFPVYWESVRVGQIRRTTIPANFSPDGRPWLFVLERFPNNEHVGGGLDTSGNQWIRYLLKVKATN